MSEKNQKFILSAIAVLVMSLLAGYLIFAWTEPSQNPPGGNVPTPINVGSTAQTKTGNLTLPNLYLNAVGNEGNIYNANIIQGYNDLILYSNSAKNATIYLEGNPVVINNDAGTGNVGIGTTAPGEKLDVQGGGIKIGNFKIRPISGTELGLYDSGGNLILIFDQGI
jgi:hypothetical protein